MNKTKISILTACFIIALAIIALIVWGNRTINIDASLKGVSVSLLSGDEQGSVNVAIKGEASYKFFALEQFNGTLAIDGDDLTLDNRYTAFIQFGNGLGYLSYLPSEPDSASSVYFGYVCTNDFNNILILPYHDDSAASRKNDIYIAAPADDLDRAFKLAEALSKNTFLSDVKWDGMNGKRHKG